jgi:hypothetical protein
VLVISEQAFALTPPVAGRYITLKKVKLSRYMPWWHMRGEEV